MADEELSKEEELFTDEEHEISTEVEVEDTKTETDTNDGEVETSDEVKTDVDTEKTNETDDKPTSVPLAALKDERRKRQQLEEENEQLRGQIPKSDEAPDPYEDIDAYDAYKRAEWEKNLNAQQAQVRNEKINKSRGEMLEKVVDYDEMEAIFQVMTATDRGLVDKMLLSENPAKFAYDTAKTYKESLLKVAPKVETEPSESEKRNKSATEVPNLAPATAQASNSQQIEKEATIDDVFADIGY